MTKFFEDHIKNNVLLAPYTTMGVGGAAKYFAIIRNVEVIPEAIKWARLNNLPILVLGGGSNIVISDSGFPGLVIKMENRGIKIIREAEEVVEISVGAGESWDVFVEYAVNQGLWGIENMSFIPGTVGAVAVQNVSAYGQESRMVINKVCAYDMSKEKFVDLNNDECNFDFRKSIFNTTGAGRYLIIAISFSLKKNGRPNMARREIEYVIKKQRKLRGVPVFGIRTLNQKPLPNKTVDVAFKLQEIRQAVIKLRTSGRLLPSPNTVGNCGTFFQVSVISNSQLFLIARRALKNVGLPLALKILACKFKYSSNGRIKLPARIFIEACSLDKLCYGSISLYKTNRAVLVNSGNCACATDILKLIRKIRTIIYCKTNVVVPIEPVLIGFTDEELKRTLSLTEGDVESIRTGSN